MAYAFLGTVSACIVGASVMTLSCGAGAGDSNSIVTLAGRWAGHATMTQVSGPSEDFKCVVTYFPSADGSRVKQNLRCRGESTKFDAATHLQIAGREVTGSWEDNVYSLNGSVRGNVTDKGFDIVLLGRYFQAYMRVVTSACEQSVTVTPDRSTNMKELAAVLKKC